MAYNYLSDKQKLEITAALNRLYMLLSFDFISLSTLDTLSSQFDKKTHHFLSEIRKEIVKLLAITETGHSNILDHYLDAQNHLVSKPTDKEEVKSFQQEVRNNPDKFENNFQTRFSAVLTHLKKYEQLFLTGEHFKKQVKECESLLKHLPKKKAGKIHQFSHHLNSQSKSETHSSEPTPSKRKP